MKIVQLISHKLYQDAELIGLTDDGGVLFFNSYRKCWEVISSPEELVEPEMVIDIIDLDLPTRVINRLRRHGINNLAQLKRAMRVRGGEDIAKLSNIGEVSFKLIKDTVEYYGRD